MALTCKEVVILAILVVIKVGFSEASSLPTVHKHIFSFWSDAIHKLEDTAYERCTTAYDEDRTQDFSLVSELINKDGSSVLEVNQANIQYQLCKQPYVEVESTSAPKEQIPYLMLETSHGNSSFPAEILFILLFLALYFLGADVLNLAIPAIIFFAMMFFLGIN